MKLLTGDTAPSAPCPSDNTAGLPALIRKELAEAIRDLKMVERPDEFPHLQHLILFVCFLANIVFFLAWPGYVALFVAASFYLNMFYFVSLLIPTNPSAAGFLTRDVTAFLSRLMETGLLPGTYRITRILVSAFFINSRALTSGIGLVFSFDIILCVIAYFTMGILPMTILMVILQALIIVVFYLLVWRFEPFSDRFGKNVERLKGKLSREKVPGWIVAGLFFLGFLVAVFLILITIILLPGMTVSFFLSTSSLSAIGNIALLLAPLAITQYFVIRSIHGYSSRELAIRLCETKKKHLEVLFKQMKSHGDGATFFDPIAATTILLESRIYQVEKKTLLSLFPVYVINLDFSAALECTAISAIKGYIRETHPDH